MTTQVIVAGSPPAAAGPAPLSYGQHRMWSLGQIMAGSAANLVLAVRLSGSLNLPALAQAFTDLTLRHQVLRSAIDLHEGEPVQRVVPAERVAMRIVDLRGLASGAAQSRLDGLLGAEAARPFDLTRPPLIRVTVIAMSARDHVAVVAMHHAATDGWSLGRLATEISALYAAYGHGEPPGLRGVPTIQFGEYAREQRSRSWDPAAESAPWLEGIDEAAAGTLAVSRPRGDRPNGAGLRTTVIGPALTNRLADLRRQEGGTLFHLVLSAWICVAHRLDGRERVLVATLASGRTSVELEPSIGCFVNVLPVGAAVTGEMSFRELWRQVRQRCVEAYAHQDIPYERLLPGLQTRSETGDGRNPIRVLCVAQPPTPALDLAGVEAHPVPVLHETAQFDLTIEFREQDGALRFGLQHDTSVLDGPTVALLGEYLKAVLEHVVSDVDTPCGAVRLDREGPRAQFEAPPTADPGTLHGKFEARCALAPDAVALTHRDQSFTYKALNAEANRLAKALRARGVGLEDRVAIRLPRGPEAVIAILAALKAGAAYVPIDPAYPQTRIEYMLDDSAARCVVTDELAIVDRDAGPRQPAARRVDSRNLAYVMYTSGTTGRPKGVLGQHDATLHRLRWMWREHAFAEGERACHRTSLSFVDSVWEIFGPLLAGVPADILDADAVADPETLVAALELHGTTRIVVVPSLLGSILDTVPALDARLAWLRTWVTSGERLPLGLARRFHEALPGRRLLNLYGCTEVAADATAAAVPEAVEVVTIGRPISGATAAVTDRAGTPVPALVVGELRVGGPIVARGYHRAPALTADRFRPDGSAAGARVYRTGDTARVLAGGEIEYLGRMDHQLKIRGVRVDPSDVEDALLGHPSVIRAAVTGMAEAGGAMTLVAFVVVEKTFDPERLRAHLGTLLPSVAIPSLIVPVEALALTANGKVDRARLPLPDVAASRRPVVGRAPRTRSERLVAQVFGELLPLLPKSVEEDFFALGGHSLLATAVLYRLRQRTGVTLGLRDLFAAPSVAGLSRLLDDFRGDVAPEASEPELAARPQEQFEPFPLTEVQQAYWVGRSADLTLGNVATHAYFEIDGHDIDPERLQDAVRRLVSRHAGLRAIVMDTGQQRILPEVTPYVVRVQDLRECEPAAREQALVDVRESMSHQVLSATRWPLFDIRLSLYPGGAARVHVSIDALIADAFSVQLLTSELAHWYHEPQAVIQPLTLTCRDVIVAAAQRRSLPGYERSLSYWRERVATLPTGPELPLGRSAESVIQPRFRRWAHRLPSATWQALSRRAAAAGVTPAAALLTAFTEVLTVWSRHPHYTVMLTLFNRQGHHPDLYRVVGDFTSVTPLEIDHREQASFQNRARATQERMWSDLDHREVSGITVLREWTRQRGGRPGLLAPVVFTANLGLPDHAAAAPHPPLGVPGYSVTQTPQAYLDHQVAEAPDGLVLHWDAVTELFPPGLIDAMFDAYIAMLTDLADGTRPWDIPVTRLVPLAQRRRRAVVNSTARRPDPRTLTGCFLASAHRFPDAPAVIAAGRELSYQELAGRAAQVGLGLRARGVCRGDLVGVSAAKGWQQAVAALAVTSLGAAYVPLDPDLPAERMRLLVESTAAKAVIVQSGREHNRGLDGVVLVEVDEALSGRELLPDEADPGDLAYVIFTSGSTGTPKGVMIDHRGAVNTITDINERFGVGPGDRVLGLSSLSFDLSVYDLFGIWAIGGAAVLPDADRLKDPGHWLELLRDNRIAVWNSVPALLDLAVSYAESTGGTMDSVRLAMVSGDWIPITLPDRFRRVAPAAGIVSLGGATEASIWSVYYRIGEVDPDWTSIPYGRPLANQRVHVLDSRGEARPDWVAGDLYLAGTGLALGYWADQVQTQQQFIIHPGTRERLYRTGDLARFRPDGELEFLGREDDQVKISGFRIELGEIEAAMRRIAGVTACAATAIGPRFGDRRLAAFYVADAGAGPGQEDVRAALMETVPAYLVPATVLRLDALPLSRQGKVDRSALAALVTPVGAAPEPAPEQLAEPPQELVARLCAIWTAVLDVAEVGPRDNFFLLGGTSLVAIRLLARLEAETGLKIPLVRLYDSPTAYELAAAIVQAQGQARPTAQLVSISPAPEHRFDPFPLTDIQEAYWLGRREGLTLGGVSTHSYVELDVSDLDADRLELAINRLVERHDALRTVVCPDGTQRVLAETLRYEVRRYEGGLDKVRERLSHRVYDVTRWPLFDVAVSHLPDGRTRVHIGVDLIVADALSFHILQRELLAYYHDPELNLPTLGCTFRDYLGAVSTARHGPGRREAERYWRARLPDLPDAPPLPLARQPSEVGRPRFERLEARLGVAEWARLRETSAVRNITPSGVLCAGYADVLAMWCQAARFTLNLTTFNRLPVHPEIDGVVGDFTSTTLLAVDASAATFTQRARGLQLQIFRDLEHREFSGVEVLRALRKDPRRRRDVFAPVVFTSTLLPDLTDEAPSAPPWKAQTVYGVSQTPQVLLDFQVYENAGELILVWDHVPEAFPEAMVPEMFGAYRRLLDSLINDGGYWEAGPGWTR